MMAVMESHSEQILFDCKVCAESFKFRRALHKHVQRTHPFSVGKKGNEKRTLVKNTFYECAQCASCFMYKKLLQQHLQRRHEVVFSNEIKESVSKTHLKSEFSVKCVTCSKIFSENVALNRHIRRKHPDKWVSTRRKTDNYKCSSCASGFCYRKSLLRHIQDKHPEEICDWNAALRYSCPWCDQKFQYPLNLKQHIMKDHPNKRTYLKTAKNVFKCDECNLCFTYRFRLVRHIQKHEGRMKPKIFSCLFCDKKFIQKSTLHSHLRKKHHRHLHSNRRKREDGIFMCAHCLQCYNQRTALVFHILEKHPLVFNLGKETEKNNQKSNRRSPASRLCPLCSASFIQKLDILSHFREKHQRKIQVKTLNLPDESAFDEWKLLFEDETKSKFVKYNCYRSKSSTIKVFICHRSGCFQSKGKGVRRLRLYGTEKINGYCPAEIKLTIFQKDRRCVVHYVDEHVGHGQDLQFLKFRQPINQLEARSLPKFNDEYLLTSDDEQLTDTVILTSWISKNLDCVLYFKVPEALDPEFPELISGPEGDFVFAIMNDFQKDMFVQYAKNGVAVGQMKGPMGYDMYLFAVSVMDNYMQGVPCCFMLSNRTDLCVYEVLFKKISEQTGKIKTKAFMSEPVHVYADAWCNVMPEPEFRLWCSWDVLRYWDMNLSKIRNMELRREVRQHLFVTRIELNPFRFHELLQELLNSEDPILQDFLEYFNQYFVKNESFWAYCYRKHAGINTNYITERFFRVFKRTYLGKKIPYTFEEVLNGLNLYLEVTQQEKIIQKVRGKLVGKIKSLRLRHEQCMREAEQKLDEIQCVCEDKWLVPWFEQYEDSMMSETEDNGEDFVLPNIELYEVERILKCCDCKLRCLECKSCLHEFRCSCIDNCIKYNMCMHIHLVCTFLNRIEGCNNDEVVEILRANEIERDDL